SVSSASAAALGASWVISHTPFLRRLISATAAAEISKLLISPGLKWVPSGSTTSVKMCPPVQRKSRFLTLAVTTSTSTASSTVSRLVAGSRTAIATVFVAIVQKPPLVCWWLRERQSGRGLIGSRAATGGYVGRMPLC